MFPRLGSCVGEFKSNWHNMKGWIRWEIVLLFHGKKNALPKGIGFFNEIVADTFQSSCLLKVNETRGLVHLSDQSAIEQYYPVGYWTTI